MKDYGLEDSLTIQTVFHRNTSYLKCNTKSYFHPNKYERRKKTSLLDLLQHIGFKLYIYRAVAVTILSNRYCNSPSFYIQTLHLLLSLCIKSTKYFAIGLMSLTGSEVSSSFPFAPLFFISSAMFV